MTALKLYSQLFSRSYEKRDVSTNVPWHAVEECNVVVDMNSLCSKMDITVDRWNWILSQTCVPQKKISEILLLCNVTKLILSNK